MLTVETTLDEQTVDAVVALTIYNDFVSHLETTTDDIDALLDEAEEEGTVDPLVVFDVAYTTFKTLHILESLMVTYSIYNVDGPELPSLDYLMDVIDELGTVAAQIWASVEKETTEASTPMYSDCGCHICSCG